MGDLWESIYLRLKFPLDNATKKYYSSGKVAVLDGIEYLVIAKEPVFRRENLMRKHTHMEKEKQELHEEMLESSSAEEIRLAEGSEM
jgi:hypothetical protein